MLMYSRSQPCTVSDKLAPARSIVGSYIYPGDETHTYACVSVCVCAHKLMKTRMNAQMSGRVERTALGWGSAEEENQKSAAHCNPMASYRARVSAAPPLLCPPGPWSPHQAGLAGLARRPPTDSGTNKKVHREMRKTILQEFSVSKICIRMSRNEKPIHCRWKYKPVQVPGKQAVVPETVHSKSHLTSNATLGACPKERKAGI